MAYGKNENIVNILELIEGEEEYFIVTEYYQDGDLLNLLERISFSQQPEIALSFCIAIASGLNFLHKSKICHRDLKPENILIAKSNDGNYYIKISDFGISKQSDQMMKSTIGTITYMAPEILKFQEYDEKVDIWSFGCLVFEIFVGEQLFNGKSMKEVALKITCFNEDTLDAYKDRIPLPVIKLIKRCLKRLPQNRISLEQVVIDLVKIKAELTINMAQSMIQSQHIQKSIIRVNQNQESPSLSSTNSVEVIESNQNEIKFTDNLQDSFIEVVVNNQEYDKQQISQTTFDTQSPLKQSIFINEVKSRDEEEINQVTPNKYTNIEQNKIQLPNSSKSLDSEKQLNIQKEDQNNKKLEEKGKHSQFLQDQQSQIIHQASQNQNIQIKSNLEQSNVLETIKNYNYNPNIGTNFQSPQPTKSASNSQFLSEQQSQKTTNDYNTIIYSPITNFQGNNQNNTTTFQINQISMSNNYSNNLNQLDNTNSQNKNLNFLGSNLNPKYLQNNTLNSLQNNHNASINNLNIKSNNNHLSEQNNIQNNQTNILNNLQYNNIQDQSYQKISSAQNITLQPSNQSFNTLISTPLKNHQINEPYQQAPQQTSTSHTPFALQNLNQSPGAIDLNYQNKIITAQKMEFNTNKKKGIQSQKSFNVDTSIQNQTHINNQSSDMQQTLSIFVNIKDDKKKKIQLKLDNNQMDQESIQYFEKLKQVKNAEQEFKSDIYYLKYMFGQKKFDIINKSIPCARIFSTEDGYIFEFLSYIYKSIQQKCDYNEHNTLLHQYIQIILNKLNAYLQYSEFLKENQKLLFPFLKVLTDIIDTSGDKNQKYLKVQELTKNEKFTQFLRTFGNFLQIYPQTQTQFLYLTPETKDIDQINQFIAEKMSFKLVVKQDEQYFVHFDEN